jgi:hypothetical protein
VTPNYLSSEPEHASESYLIADMIYILILAPNQNPVNAGGMYLTFVDLSAVCLLFPYDVFYSGNDSISGNASCFGYSAGSWCVFMWPWSSFCYHLVIISNAAPWRCALLLFTCPVFAHFLMVPVVLR